MILGTIDDCFKLSSTPKFSVMPANGDAKLFAEYLGTTSFWVTATFLLLRCKKSFTIWMKSGHQQLSAIYIC
ncbi:hypothetical protein PVAP13_7KG293600 [Panicum virgatum]|uniref:Uncharacterized protein n=1 Tax=Panicum virgatum TaxID=38727 RepID=A0A8T0QP83_PANVG|nr:hypothetical protein PVAP13_7KG293600 [Panicum virgatum]